MYTSKESISLPDQHTISFIKEVVSRFYKFDPALYNQPSKKREIVFYKAVTMYVINRHVPSLALVELGRHFWAKSHHYDHSGVKHALNTFQQRLDFDTDLAIDVRTITRLVNSRLKKESSELQGYFVDLNHVHSLKLSPYRAIIFSGFTDQDVARVRELLAEHLHIGPEIQARQHGETGMYIFEKEKHG